RKRHCVPDLVLNDVLNEIAQEYADYLASTGSFAHSGNTVNDGEYLGENLYMMSGSAGVTVNGKSR
ncbi:unnamed protein product, partial [Didymodactylos carnosus]